jgi:hypothetical protein
MRVRQLIALLIVCAAVAVVLKSGDVFVKIHKFAKYLDGLHSRVLKGWRLTG